MTTRSAMRLPRLQESNCWKTTGTKDKVSGYRHGAVEEEVQESIRFANDSADPTPDILERTTYAGEFAR